MAEPETKVLYIASGTRSGSTILGSVLGALDGCFDAGELRMLWARALPGGHLCGCGSPVGDCAVWSKVLEEGFGNQFDHDRVARWQAEAVRTRHLRRLLKARRGARSGSPSLDSFADASARLYTSIGRVTGQRVIVDSSKRPADAALLRLLPGIRPYLVHLVRDPRAVAHSWRRRKPNPGDASQREMQRYRPATVARSWTVINLAIEAVRRRYGPTGSVFVRYEDFVSRPRDTLEMINKLVGEPLGDAGITEERVVELQPNHTAAGNPSRFKTGRIELRVDDEWRTRQARSDQLVTTTLALPLLRRYRYPLWPEAA